MRKLRRNPFGASPRKHRRLSPFMLVGVRGAGGVGLVGGLVFVLPRIGSHAAAAPVNGDCTLIVPPHPLTAQGLATPYRLQATDQENGPCNESNAAQAAFVQGAVLDPVTGAVSIYNPLVIDQGTQPAAAPVAPTLPTGAVVGLWFVSNGNTLTLQDDDGSLDQGHCVNGIGGSIFGQFSYCNAPSFFQAANQAIQAGTLVAPPLGKSNHHFP